MLVKLRSDIAFLTCLGNWDHFYFYLGHVAQGGQGKYNSDCRLSLSLAFSPQKHRQWKYSLKDIMADCFFA